MDLEQYSFFHRATVAICRHLRAEEALHACAHLLQDYLPVEHMFLEVWDEELGAVRAIAEADPDQGHAIDRLVPMSQKQIDLIQNARGQQPEENVFIINRSGTRTRSRSRRSSCSVGWSC